jgi:competence protein ComEC
VHVRWAVGAALLSGDVETEAQAELLRRGLPSAEIFKVPHHGSGRYDPAFFAASGARAALISVGADNDYGHPAPSTLAQLHRLGARIYRTDLSGDLAVVARDGALSVINLLQRGYPGVRAGEETRHGAAWCGGPHPEVGAGGPLGPVRVTPLLPRARRPLE